MANYLQILFEPLFPGIHVFKMQIDFNGFTYNYESNKYLALPEGYSESILYVENLENLMDSFNFGKINVGRSRIISLDMENIGEKDLTIYKILGSEGFSFYNKETDSFGDFPETILKQNQKTTLKIKFSPLENKEYAFEFDIKTNYTICPIIHVLASGNGAININKEELKDKLDVILKDVKNPIETIEFNRTEVNRINSMSTLKSSIGRDYRLGLADKDRFLVRLEETTLDKNFFIAIPYYDGKLGKISDIRSTFFNNGSIELLIKDNKSERVRIDIFKTNANKYVKSFIPNEEKEENGGIFIKYSELDGLIKRKQLINIINKDNFFVYYYNVETLEWEKVEATFKQKNSDEDLWFNIFKEIIFNDYNVTIERREIKDSFFHNYIDFLKNDFYLTAINELDEDSDKIEKNVKFNSIIINFLTELQKNTEIEVILPSEYVSSLSQFIVLNRNDFYYQETNEINTKEIKLNNNNLPVPFKNSFDMNVHINGLYLIPELDYHYENNKIILKESIDNDSKLVQVFHTHPVDDILNFNDRDLNTKYLPRRIELSFFKLINEPLFYYEDEINKKGVFQINSILKNASRFPVKIYADGKLIPSNEYEFISDNFIKINKSYLENTQDLYFKLELSQKEIINSVNSTFLEVFESGNSIYDNINLKNETDYFLLYLGEIQKTDIDNLLFAKEMYPSLFEDVFKGYDYKGIEKTSEKYLYEKKEELEEVITATLSLPVISSTLINKKKKEYIFSNHNLRKAIYFNFFYNNYFRHNFESYKFISENLPDYLDLREFKINKINTLSPLFSYLAENKESGEFIFDLKFNKIEEIAKDSIDSLPASYKNTERYFIEESINKYLLTEDLSYILFKHFTSERKNEFAEKYKDLFPILEKANQDQAVYLKPNEINSLNEATRYIMRAIITEKLTEYLNSKQERINNSRMVLNYIDNGRSINYEWKVYPFIEDLVEDTNLLIKDLFYEKKYQYIFELFTENYKKLFRSIFTDIVFLRDFEIDENELKVQLNLTDNPLNIQTQFNLRKFYLVDGQDVLFTDEFLLVKDPILRKYVNFNTFCNIRFNEIEQNDIIVTDRLKNRLGLLKEHHDFLLTSEAEQVINTDSLDFNTLVKVISVNKDKIINNLDGIENFSKLVILNCSNQNITDISKSWINLEKIKLVNLSYNGISNFKFLDGCNSIIYLNIEDNNFCPYDEYGYINNEYLKFLTNLRVVNFTRTNSDSVVLKDLVENKLYLQELYMSENDINDITSILQMRNLSKVVMKECNIDNDSFGTEIYQEDEPEIITNFKYIDFGKNKISDINKFNKFFNLNILILDNNSFSGTISIPNTKLKNLDLNYNEITHLNISRPEGLEILNLNENKITSISNLTFGNINRLKELNLENNLITMVTDDEINQFSKETKINLLGNPLTRTAQILLEQKLKEGYIIYFLPSHLYALNLNKIRNTNANIGNDFNQIEVIETSRDNFDQIFVEENETFQTENRVLDVIEEELIDIYENNIIENNLFPCLYIKKDITLGSPSDYLNVDTENNVLKISNYDLIEKNYYKIEGNFVAIQVSNTKILVYNKIFELVQTVEHLITGEIIKDFAFDDNYLYLLIQKNNNIPNYIFIKKIKLSNWIVEKNSVNLLNFIIDKGPISSVYDNIKAVQLEVNNNKLFTLISMLTYAPHGTPPRNKFNEVIIFDKSNLQFVENRDIFKEHDHSARIALYLDDFIAIYKLDSFSEYNLGIEMEYLDERKDEYTAITSRIDFKIINDLDYSYLVRNLQDENCIYYLTRKIFFDDSTNSYKFKYVYEGKIPILENFVISNFCFDEYFLYIFASLGSNNYILKLNKITYELISLLQVDSVTTPIQIKTCYLLNPNEENLVTDYYLKILNPVFNSIIDLDSEIEISGIAPFSESLSVYFLINDITLFLVEGDLLVYDGTFSLLTTLSSTDYEAGDKIEIIVKDNDNKQIYDKTKIKIGEDLLVTVVYSLVGVGGYISGTPEQTILKGANTDPVEVMWEPGYSFKGWRDRETYNPNFINPRQEINVIEDKTIIGDIITVPSDGDIIYVNINATGNNDGTSWENAYTNLLSAFQDFVFYRNNHGVKKVVWVAQGTYRTNNEGDRSWSFEFPDKIVVYGGFIGNESALEERDWENNETILSGDVNSPDGKGTYLGVLRVTSTIIDTTVDGFSITGGDSTDQLIGGGGVYIPYGPYGSPDGGGKITIKNTKIYNNKGKTGGGIACYGGLNPYPKSVIHLENVEVYNNECETLQRSGIYDYSGEVNFVNCNFHDNYALSDTLHLFGTSGITFQDVSSVNWEGGEVTYRGNPGAYGIVHSLPDFAGVTLEKTNNYKNITFTCLDSFGTALNFSRFTGATTQLYLNIDNNTFMNCVKCIILPGDDDTDCSLNGNKFLSEIACETLIVTSNSLSEGSVPIKNSLVNVLSADYFVNNNQDGAIYLQNSTIVNSVFNVNIIRGERYHFVNNLIYGCTATGGLKSSPTLLFTESNNFIQPASISRGTWNVATTYKFYDVVLYGGIYYKRISYVNGAGHQPDISPSIWSVMADPGNPNFVGSGDDPYDLALGSPCIDNGNPGYNAGSYDIIKRPRTVNIIDIGAYENQGI